MMLTSDSETELALYALSNKRPLWIYNAQILGSGEEIKDRRGRSSSRTSNPQRWSSIFFLFFKPTSFWRRATVSWKSVWMHVSCHRSVKIGLLVEKEGSIHEIDVKSAPPDIWVAANLVNHCRFGLFKKVWLNNLLQSTSPLFCLLKYHLGLVWRAF